jgi:hypothetical protein
MLSLLLSLSFSDVPPPLLQEIALGEWSIETSTFSTASPASISIALYSIQILPTAISTTFEGELFLRNETSPVEVIDTVRLAFDPANADSVAVSIGETVADVSFNTSQLGLKSCVGRLGADSYSISILSYKAIEVTVMDEAENRVAISRMFKKVEAPSSGGGLMQYLPLLMVLWFLFGNRRKDPAPAPEKEKEKED